MPLYQSHKIVRALRIYDLKPRESQPGAINDGALLLVPDDEGYTPFWISPEYVARHAPIVGGYFVVYEDGYQSFSPASAFESGYTPAY